MGRLFVASTTGVTELGEARELAPMTPLPPAEQLRLKSLWSDLPRRLAETALGQTTKELFVDEVCERTFQNLHRILTSDTSGAYSVGTNLFEFRIDFDAQQVTIDHVAADEPAGETMPLERFRYLITAAPDESGTGT